MTEHTNTPELRFPEFNEEWNQNKLSDVVNVYDGTHKTPKYTNEGIKFLSVENIKTLNSNKYISKKDFIKEFKIHPEYGDVLMTRIGDIGTPNIVNVKEPLAYYVSLALLKPININSYFLNSLILSPTVQNELWRKTLHIAFPKKINKNEIAKVLINYPTFNEQEKIGYFFSKLDQQIELEEKKLELLEQQKRGYMQKIFSRELRFKDENGNDYPDWKLKKLSNIADIIGGGTPSTKKSEYWDGDINWFSPVEIGDKEFVSTSQRRITEKGLEKSSAKMLPIGTVLFTSRAGIGKTAILSKEATTNQGFQSIVPKENDLDSYFLYSMTSILKRNAEKVGAGSTFSEVSRKQMEQIKLLIPILKEQKQIGRLFQIINRKINKQIHKIELLKQRKKGLLQKMFV